MSDKTTVQTFRDLHVPGKPVILYNVWDAGSANVVASAGAQAIATSSWSVAATQNLPDGEVISLDQQIQTAKAVIANTDLPVTVDFEGGYAEEPEQLAANITKLLAAGPAGINFEDQKVKGSGLYDTEIQCQRLKTIRDAVKRAGTDLFINARTDVFLRSEEGTDHSTLMDDVLERMQAYADAGADGLFAPALKDPALIERLCKASPIPVNLLFVKGIPSNKELADLGVARISYGHQPYTELMDILHMKAHQLFSS